MKQTFYQQNIGQTFEILWEGQRDKLENGNVRVLGYTPNYLRVACEINEGDTLENQINAFRLEQIKTDYAFGRIVGVHCVNPHKQGI